MVGGTCHLIPGRMKAEPPRRGREGHGASFGGPSAHRPATPPRPPLPGRPAATPAAPPRRGPPAVGRRTRCRLHRRPPRRPRQRRPCRFPGPRTLGPALLAGDPTPRGAPAFDPGTARGHLAFGRAVSPRPRLAVRPPVAGQTPRLPGPRAPGEGHQPRAPAEGAEKRGTYRRRVRRKLPSTDPQRRAILRRLEGSWRRRTSGSLLASFDAQPITVKAHGGRRHTRERRLILAARQKTRGRFYLSLLYLVDHGRARRAYFPGKGADHVCRFMRRVRRWHPAQRLRVALDRDPAHPREAKRTRRLMRRLGLRWTSSPKGGPDDNPAETLFSDAQQAVPDNSDDPDAKATRRRISATCGPATSGRTASGPSATWALCQRIGDKFLHPSCDATGNSSLWGRRRLRVSATHDARSVSVVLAGRPLLVARPVLGAAEAAAVGRATRP